MNGLVGTRVIELLREKFTFIQLSRSMGLDVTQPNTIESLKNYKYADFVLHMAAKTDVDGCEKDKSLGENGEAWKINVDGAKNVAEICHETNKKMIYISTDFVFNGENEAGEAYSEDDLPDPINWYAKTKYEGEKRVMESGCNYLIVRLAYPYRAKYEAKPDFMRAIKGRLEQRENVKGVTDHIFCPTFIDDFARAIEILIKNNASGIYHAVGSQSLSPYQASLNIAEAFGFDKSLISKTTREEFFKDRAPRPFNLALANDRIEELGVKFIVIRGYCNWDLKRVYMLSNPSYNSLL